MLVKDSKGLEARIEITGDYDDDIQINEAVYINSGLDVCDKEVDFIMDKYAAEINQEWFENRACYAEYACEGDR